MYAGKSCYGLRWFRKFWLVNRRGSPSVSESIGYRRKAATITQLLTTAGVSSQTHQKLLLLSSPANDATCGHPHPDTAKPHFPSVVCHPHSPQSPLSGRKRSHAPYPLGTQSPPPLPPQLSLLEAGVHTTRCRTFASLQSRRRSTPNAIQSLNSGVVVCIFPNGLEVWVADPRPSPDSPLLHFSPRRFHFLLEVAAGQGGKGGRVT